MEPEGWRAAWFAEIEAFPSAVLAHHYPCVSNLGDMTKIALAVLMRKVAAPDVLVGGTPCQAFSVAGSRNSLADERGNLTLRYVELANAIDDVRRRAGQPDSVIWWENVPGVLSTKDNAFGCFLAGLAGSDGPLEPPTERPAAGKSSRFWKWNKERQEHTPSWSNAGAVYGPRRAVAWRTLDAQYFGLAQRRRRVFVVASARAGFDPATVLFEWDGLRRDTSPRRTQGQITAASLAASAGHHGYSSPRGDGSDNLIADTLRGHPRPGSNTMGAAVLTGIPDVSLCLNAGGMGRIDSESETMIPVAFDSRQDPISSTDVFGSLGSSSPQAQAVAFTCKDYGADAGEIAPTLRAMGHASSHANAGGQLAVAFNARQDPDSWEERSDPLDTDGTTQAVMAGLGVRRLTPRECERLQGFPDDYTLIPIGRAVRPEKLDADWIKYLMRGGRMTREECSRAAADGPRYKALGNSMATHVIRWIGRRIERAVTDEMREAA
ncbi:DNA cytosine methyltransferase [Dyella kyungheensis]